MDQRSARIAEGLYSMEDRERIWVDTRAYVSILRELTEAGKEVSLKIAGNSMSPFLVHDRDYILFKKPERPLKKGDMVFYQRVDGSFVMHRLVRVKKDGYYMVGDAQTYIEGPLKREQIFARITQVKRKGVVIGPGNFWWEFFEHVWIRVVPLRPFFLRLYGKFATKSRGMAVEQNEADK